MAERKPPVRKPSAHTPALEWIAAGIGLLLAATAIWFVGREALVGDPTPPAITVRALEIRALPEGYLVTVDVRNLGSRPAAQVLVEGELTPPGAESEIVQTTFDYVPGRSTRRGGLFFREDPRGKPMRLYAKGFVDP